MTGERGVTLVELVVSVAIGTIVLFATLALVDVSSRNTARIAHRVDVNQQVRPVMQHLMDTLHSACVSPGVPPVLNGSTESAISFTTRTGAEVSPAPDWHVVWVQDGVLYEYEFPSDGSPTTRTLLSDVGAAQIGDPPTAVPLFRYFAYEAGQTSLVQLQTPLSVDDAQRTVRVDVAFSLDPDSNPTRDENAGLSVSDAALLRFEPAQGGGAEGNRPCV